MAPELKYFMKIIFYWSLVFGDIYFLQAINRNENHFIFDLLIAGILCCGIRLGVLKTLFVNDRNSKTNAF